MIPATILQDIETLPSDAQRQVIDFIDFMKTRYRVSKNKLSQPNTEKSFGVIKVNKRVTLEQMDEAIRQRGGVL